MGRRDRQQSGDAACTVDDFWLPTHAGSLGASWFWPSRPIDPDVVGALIVPSIGHEEQTMAVGLVALARELAGRGMPALLVDLTGTAQGADTLDVPDIGARWADDVRSAVKHMRDAGLRHVAVVGVRLGALVAADALVEDPVDLLAMWAPVMSGRRFVRELQMMQGAATGPVGDPVPGITVAGFTLPPTVVDHIKSLDASKLDGKPASRVTLIDSIERLAGIDDDHPMLAAVPVDRLEAEHTERWLFTAADAYPAPFGDLGVVARQIAVAGSCPTAVSDMLPTPVRPDVSDLRTHVVEHDGVPIRETFVELGAGSFPGGGRLTGILSEPFGHGDPDRAYVAVTAVGPGRIFVELARREAALGRACLRLNLSGFGTSSRRPGEAWADFYAPSATAEIDAAIDELSARGFRSVHVVGFCAGAWAAMGLPTRPELASIIGINAQLMIRRRLPHRQMWPQMSLRNHLLARLADIDHVVRIVKGLELRVPWPTPVLRRMGRRVAAGTDVTLVFDTKDGGYEYVRRMTPRPFGIRSAPRRPTLQPYDGLGHLPSGPARERMLADLHAITT